MCACHGPKQEGVQSAVTAIPQHSSVGANSLTRGPTRVTTLTLTQAVGYNPGRYFSRGLGWRADPGRLLPPGHNP
jgi:hypothetical protein